MEQAGTIFRFNEELEIGILVLRGLVALDDMGKEYGVVLRAQNRAAPGNSIDLEKARELAAKAGGTNPKLPGVK